jgi:type II secretory pathway pseudopilin PulG
MKHKLAVVRRPLSVTSSTALRTLLQLLRLRKTENSKRTKSSGFTILEVCIAMTIGLLLVGVATLGVTGIKQESDLKNQAADIENSVRTALLDAISKHYPVQIALDGGFTGAKGQVEIKRHGETKYRPAKRGEFWEFSPTGVCEPIDIRVTSVQGVIELSFDPLTGCARKKNIIVRT